MDLNILYAQNFQFIAGRRLPIRLRLPHGESAARGQETHGQHAAAEFMMSYDITRNAGAGMRAQLVLLPEKNRCCFRPFFTI